MVQLIVGEKGKGKTKHLLDKVNSEVKTIPGNIVYLDKSTKHMYELNNKVRLIDVSQYLIENNAEFLGFISGIISQDHDLQELYLDSFMDVAFIKDKSMIPEVFNKLDKISSQFSVDFIISVSLEVDEVPEEYKSQVIVAL